MASNMNKMEYGDKVLVVDTTNHGLLVRRIAIFIGAGYGLGVNRYNTNNRCCEGDIHSDWETIKENSRYCIVMYPKYDSFDGTITWIRHSAMLANVMLDRASVREMDEETRRKMRDQKWLNKIEEAKYEIDREINRKIVSDVFGSVYVDTDMLANLLVEKGIHPGVDKTAMLDAKLAEMLKKFNRDQLHATPMDF